MLKDVANLLNFHNKARNAFSLAKGDVPNVAASYYIEQLGVYIAALEAAMPKPKEIVVPESYEAFKARMQAWYKEELARMEAERIGSNHA